MSEQTPTPEKFKLIDEINQVSGNVKELVNFWLELRSKYFDLGQKPITMRTTIEQDFEVNEADISPLGSLFGDVFTGIYAQLEKFSFSRDEKGQIIIKLQTELDYDLETNKSRSLYENILKKFHEFFVKETMITHCEKLTISRLIEVKEACKRMAIDGIPKYLRSVSRDVEPSTKPRIEFIIQVDTTTGRKNLQIKVTISEVQLFKKMPASTEYRNTTLYFPASTFVNEEQMTALLNSEPLSPKGREIRRDMKELVNEGLALRKHKLQQSIQNPQNRNLSTLGIKQKSTRINASEGVTVYIHDSDSNQETIQRDSLIEEIRKYTEFFRYIS